MKKRIGLVALLALAGIIAAVALSLASQETSAQAPSPTSGHQLVSGLVSPRGLKVGPDGMIYVAEAGNGGDTVLSSPDGDIHTGLTGRVSKVDPATGTRTTVAGNLPSIDSGEGPLGPADVAFIGTQLYYVQTAAGAAFGFTDHPTGIYKINADGSTTLVADIGTFVSANPSTSVGSGAAPDVLPGGNPYSMTVRDGNFYVVDGNQNDILKVTPAGVISHFAEFAADVTTTGIAFSGSGPFYVSTLGPGPFNPSDGTIQRVGYPTGAVAQVASGVSSLTDVEYGPGGQLYALNFADQAADLSGGLPWTPFTGKLWKVDVATGTFTPVVDGFFATTSVAFSGDTAYVSNYGLADPMLPPGEIWEVDNVSSLQPLAVTPTAVPPTTAPAATATSPSGVVPPNTGSGPDGSSSFPWAIALIGALGALALGAGVVRRQAR